MTSTEYKLMRHETNPTGFRKINRKKKEEVKAARKRKNAQRRHTNGT
jgi:hypothetical protein